MGKSAWSVDCDVVDVDGNIHRHCWDMWENTMAATQTGIFVGLYRLKDQGQWELKSGFEIYLDNYPHKPEGHTGLDFTLSKCVEFWNRYIRDTFNIGESPDQPPLFDGYYDQVKARLMYENNTFSDNEAPE